MTDWLGEADDWGEEEEKEDNNGNFGWGGGGGGEVLDGSQSQSHNNMVAPLK